MSAELIQSFVPMLLRGLRVTMQIAVTGILLGFVLGSLSGYALQSRNRVARGIANVYVWIIRGTPIVVQALYVCFVVPALITLARGSRYTMDSNLAGTIVITLNAGAFISPIVKGALESIDIGQKEAGPGPDRGADPAACGDSPAFKSMIPVQPVHHLREGYGTALHDLGE